jgi:transposase
LPLVRGVGALVGIEARDLEIGRQRHLEHIDRLLRGAERQWVGAAQGQIGAQPRIKALEAELLAWHKASEESRRLETIPGVGFITATAIAATVADPSQFRSGREFAAWLGLTPRQNSSGGRERSGRISKKGDGYLRTLLVVGATAVLRYTRQKPTWMTALLARKPARLVTVALANKTARIAWALLAKAETYKVPAAAA